ncbi:hypothetical protein H0H92_015756, partial [Tricholoma furcatifolium]
GKPSKPKPDRSPLSLKTNLSLATPPSKQNKSVPAPIPTPATPKANSNLNARGKPAFKVPAKVERPTKSASSPGPNFKSTENDIYPRALVRSPVLDHPALPYARSKFKPATYPRPPDLLQDSKTKSERTQPVLTGHNSGKGNGMYSTPTLRSQH